ncbi:MAG: trypsin-like peptidase domain-containing protein [Salinigranum sp.]
MSQDRFTRRGALKALGAVGLAGTAPLVTQARPAANEPQQRPPGAGWLQARNAVVRIDTFGTYDFPELPGIGVETPTGGSGFVVDPSGVAVTANHVVTGAATLQVYVGDDTQRSYNASVLGASECSDLAVIKIHGSGFPALNVASQPVRSGTQVYAYGFPVNSTELSTTDGIVSRTDVSGESNWASVDSVIEHTAKVNFGNSGGPLVNASGAVVGVNYAAYLELDQNLAIGTPVANPIITTLRRGKNVEYIGINSVAIETEAPLTPDGIDRAIHVISVESGSPAFNAGIRAGDRILRIENTQAVRPSTETELPNKAFYCDVLRTKGSDSVIAVQVLRQAPGQTTGGLLLEGTINGEPLRPVGRVGGAGGGAASYGSYSQASDDSGTITVELPNEWSDVRGTPSSLGPRLVAAPDVNGYLTPGTSPASSPSPPTSWAPTRTPCWTSSTSRTPADRAPGPTSQPATSPGARSATCPADRGDPRRPSTSPPGRQTAPTCCSSTSSSSPTGTRRR